MKTIAFINQKGGVAKTTSCINVGAALASLGYKVLLIDLDPQGSLSKSLGCRDLEDADTINEVIRGADPNGAIIKDLFNYDILPANIRLSGAEIDLIMEPGRDTLLKDAIKRIKTKYDYILIDCPPSLSILTLMALAAANQLIIPVAAQYLPLDGLAQLLKTIDKAKERLNKKLSICGILITMYNSRRALDADILQTIRDRFAKEAFTEVIKINSKLAEAPTAGKDIFTYAPKSPGAESYLNVAQELIKRTM